MGLVLTFTDPPRQDPSPKSIVSWGWARSPERGPQIILVCGACWWLSGGGRGEEEDENGVSNTGRTREREQEVQWWLWIPESAKSRWSWNQGFPESDRAWMIWAGAPKFSVRVLHLPCGIGGRGTTPLGARVLHIIAYSMEANIVNMLQRLYICIYIYIYIWLWARLPPQILPFLAFFPQFHSKNGEKEMLQICPISLFTFLVKMTQKGPGTAVPSIFWKKDTGTAVPGGFSWFIWVSKLIFCLFGKKNEL